MAYQYQGAIARKKGVDALWSEVNLSAVDINTIFATYKQVFLTLSHPALQHNIYLDLELARPIIGVYIGTKTVAQWLVENGNATLPTQNTIPQFRLKPALYADAWAAGYNIEAVDRSRAPDAQIPPSEKKDLLLSKEGVDFRIHWRHCLVTVNGYFHRCGGSQEGLYVVDGGRTGNVSKNNHVGIYSFRDVGTLKTYPITPDMVYKTHEDQKYAQIAHIALPENVEGKTVFLVLGGYLHALDRTYVVSGPKSVTIDMNNYQLAPRLYQSWDAINLDPLDLETSPNNARQIVVEELFDDSTILAYLTLPQSFVVVLDTPSVYIRRHTVERSDLPGRFIAPMPLQRFPLISSLGRVFDYRAFPEHGGRCVLATDPALNVNYNFSTRHWRDEVSIDPTRYSAMPWKFAPGELLEIGRFD